MLEQMEMNMDNMIEVGKVEIRLEEILDLEIKKTDNGKKSILFINNIMVRVYDNHEIAFNTYRSIIEAKDTGETTYLI